MQDRLDQIEQFMIEQVTGERINTAITTNRDDFKMMQAEFERVQPIKELQTNAGFTALYRQLAVEAEEAAKSVRDYSGADEKEILKLNHRLQRAEFARKRVREIVENAIDTPRPVFRNE